MWSIGHAGESGFADFGAHKCVLLGRRASDPRITGHATSSGVVAGGRSILAKHLTGSGVLLALYFTIFLNQLDNL
jgi:hypothetical protein